MGLFRTRMTLEHLLKGLVAGHFQQTLLPDFVLAFAFFACRHSSQFQNQLDDRITDPLGLVEMG